MATTLLSLALAPPRSPASATPRFPLPLARLQLRTPFLNSCSHTPVARLAAAAGNSQEVEVEEESESSCPFDIARLELYTERVPSEVLRVHAVVDGEEDQVLIFKVSLLYPSFR